LQNQNNSKNSTTKIELVRTHPPIAPFKPKNRKKWNPCPENVTLKLPVLPWTYLVLIHSYDYHSTCWQTIHIVKSFFWICRPSPSDFDNVTFETLKETGEPVCSERCSLVSIHKKKSKEKFKQCSVSVRLLK